MLLLIYIRSWITFPLWCKKYMPGIWQLLLWIFQVVGLDLVDDESKPERRPTKHMPTPDQWTNAFNPAFSYYVYYCYANLYTLNKVHANTFFISILTYMINSNGFGVFQHMVW